MTLKVVTDHASASVLNNYRFTLLKSDVAHLEAIKASYSLGDGIYWYSGEYDGVIVDLIEA